ncbi:nitrite reductase large subunit NirB [Mycolicibacterium austroafricanum]|uniref:assimilatory sulfite reductase (ferredoxin) n=2 Tax=Mycolicibacterium TaxID=1866885 RepID=A1TAT9_MYCVP|nr:MULTISPECIES: nitrite reductase large subunit NirB [Mycolicibacterium]ABM14289.1 nitrite reductase (NAD(P)H), large subunit [Mycolicibacterium vanbaalenii PYR-1]MDN4519797.1 nitrite reductase large subunit NirB [Mycolicibacterium austroafricanum]MDW5613078.1 nitrite reductase large subunit NirB [Mycolicibacterium sp. D5.8-2]QRZ04792.1 NAD(P)/FAD-dependent oxidoreductase [Mycolicibacterium austroafricanum]QZT54822.1 nitrite reductase large subunit NirB [Mycolicibacterium austroafricanum]
MAQRLVVVGNGMAGVRALEEVLARGGGEHFEITVFGDEPYGNYNRILLSNVLAGVDDPTEIYLNTLDWYNDNGIDLRAGVRVVRLDAFAHLVHADDGTTLHYDKLILATGSRSFFPPMAGLWSDNRTLTDGVFGFRTLDDTAAMIAEAASRSKAVVIGGGLLGLEAARGLQNRGLTVDVVHAGPTLMNAQLDDPAGAILRKSVEDLGIGVHTDKRTTEVITDDADRLRGVLFSDGSRLDCDMLVIAAGIRPNVGLAQRAGLTVERAIVTDDHMRSIDDDDVYVVGECAQHRGQVYGLVAPLWEQAKVLADHITGTDLTSAYHGSRVATKLKVAGVDVASMGVKAPEHPDDEFVQYSEPKHGVYKTVVIRDGKLVGATLVGDVSKVSFLTQAYDSGLPLPDERVALMFDIGTPDVGVGVAELADDAQVCNCNGVTKGALVSCVHGGETSLSGVMAKTRAGKGCGSCKELVGQIVEWAAGGAVTEDPSASWYVPGIPYDKPTLMRHIRELELHSVSSVFAALAPDGREDAGSKMALASLLETMWADEFVDERDARFINDRVHANIQRDGTFSVVPQMKGGVTSVGQLRRIADVAEKYEIPMIKLTGGQRIDLLGVRKEDLPAVWADLDMPSGYAYGKSFRTVKTCVGSDFCRYGVGDSTALGIAIEERYQGLASPAKMKLAVTGCPRNCAEALCKDLGVVAVDGGRWEIYVGGAAGAHIRKGDLLATVDDAQTVITLTGRFLQYYRESANWLERTYKWVPRVGIEHIRAVIVEDADGLAAGLDERMQKSVDAYRDPWQDGREPASVGQFRSALPLLPLPRVPVR